MTGWFKASTIQLLPPQHPTCETPGLGPGAETPVSVSPLSGGARGKLFDFLLQPQFLFLEFSDAKIVAAGVMRLVVDLLFKSLMSITKLGNVRLQRHLIPSFR